ERQGAADHQQHPDHHQGNLAAPPRRTRAPSPGHAGHAAGLAPPPHPAQVGVPEPARPPAGQQGNPRPGTAAGTGEPRLGDSTSVPHHHPGLWLAAHDPSNPNATTDCSYTWSQAGSYQVSATVYWSVSWTAVGAAGGGNLGVQAGPAAQVPVTVTESQAINTSSPGGNSGR